LFLEGRGGGAHFRRSLGRESGREDSTEVARQSLKLETLRGKIRKCLSTLRLGGSRSYRKFPKKDPLAYPVLTFKLVCPQFLYDLSDREG